MPGALRICAPSTFEQMESPPAPSRPGRAGRGNFQCHAARAPSTSTAECPQPLAPRLGGIPLSDADMRRKRHSGRTDTRWACRGRALPHRSSDCGWGSLRAGGHGRGRRSGDWLLRRARCSSWQPNARSGPPTHRPHPSIAFDRFEAAAGARRSDPCLPREGQTALHPSHAAPEMKEASRATGATARPRACLGRQPRWADSR